MIMSYLTHTGFTNIGKKIVDRYYHSNNIKMIREEEEEEELACAK
jgi:hypothetical protein